jgi:hypothetical protein
MIQILSVFVLSVLVTLSVMSVCVGLVWLAFQVTTYVYYQIGESPTAAWMLWTFWGIAILVAARVTLNTCYEDMNND